MKKGSKSRRHGKRRCPGAGKLPSDYFPDLDATFRAVGVASRQQVSEAYQRESHPAKSTYCNAAYLKQYWQKFAGAAESIADLSDIGGPYGMALERQRRRRRVCRRARGAATVLPGGCFLYRLSDT
jgi:hypothetical protein